MTVSDLSLAERRAEARRIFEENKLKRVAFFRKHYRANREANVNSWCWISTLRPTKDNGQIQPCFEGVKICTFAKLAGYERYKRWPTDGEQSSHRCLERRCFNPSHIVYESAEANNARKNCLVWIECPHTDEDCERVAFVCPHNPPCIKYREGFATQENLLLEGTHLTSLVEKAHQTEEVCESVTSQLMN